MKILFLPIDIKISELDISKLCTSTMLPSRYQSFWATQDIAQLNYPELANIINQLPFTKITKLYFKEQTTFVKPHCDVYPDMMFNDGEYQHILSNEPIGYRIVLTGDKNKIFIKSQGNFIQAILPKVPGCYVINSTESYHVVLDDPGRKIIYVRGFVDIEKHKNLITRSLNLYKDLAIVEN